MHSDSLRRHEKTHTKNSVKPVPKVSKACDRCNALKTRCDKGNPCTICAKRGLQCTFDRSFKRESRSASILSGNEHEEMQVCTFLSGMTDIHQVVDVGIGWKKTETG